MLLIFVLMFSYSLIEGRKGKIDQTRSQQVSVAEIRRKPLFVLFGGAILLDLFFLAFFTIGLRLNVLSFICLWAVTNVVGIWMMKGVQKSTSAYD